MILTLHRDVWAMVPNPDRPAFPGWMQVPAGTHVAVRCPNPLIKGGADWLLVKVGDVICGMTEAGWLKKAGRPHPEPATESEPEWSF